MSADPTMFYTPLGRRLYDAFDATVHGCDMPSFFQKGVVLAFSGGADSVFLLEFMYEFRRRNGDFPMKAVHVHHGIRGEEADRDAQFSVDACRRHAVDIEVLHRDAPAYAKAHAMGLEEAARAVRYEALRSCLCDGRYAYIVTAHHATDQLETVLFHMMRGSGTQGMCGMAPISADVLRPMLDIAKRDIVSFLQQENIAYVEDSTNFSVLPMRNYIRHEILPHLEHLTPDPERQVTRMTKHLREDARYLDRIASESFVCQADGSMRAQDLIALDKVVLARVLKLWLRTRTDVSPEATHLDAVFRLLHEDKPFSYSFPGGVVLSSDRRTVRILRLGDIAEEPVASGQIPLHMGWQHFDEHGFSICLSEAKNTDISLNVYKISIQADLSSAIIDGALFLRFRKEGDAYTYGGMTHKVKKLFADRHYSAAYRRSLPILCDDKGIVWVPGFGVRQDRKKTDRENPLYITFAAHDTFADCFCL